MNLLKNTIDKLVRKTRQFRDTEQLKINHGIAQAKANRQYRFDHLSDYEFSVFSQWGEDGIIQHLVNSLDIENRTFVEFGVENFYESNCRFLMIKDAWSGLVIDGSQNHVDTIKNSYYFWRYDLAAICSFIDKDNINAIIDSADLGKIGILSVDIDGVDWFVLESIIARMPSIVIVEYNGLFGSQSAVSVPYNPSFVRSAAHHSNIYYGASIAAFDVLARANGYALVGGNSVGSNAFFVRRHLLNDRVREVAVTEAYRPTAFREARDAGGRLTFPKRKERRHIVGHLPLVDVITKETLLVSELPPESE
jgi:hypothetical protein